MPNRVHGLPPQVITACAILASGLIAIAVITKVPLSPLTFIFVATPLMWLFGVWTSYRAMSRTLNAMKVGELKAGSLSLQEWVGIAAIFGLFGISVSLMMGLILGRMSAR